MYTLFLLWWSTTTSFFICLSLFKENARSRLFKNQMKRWSLIERMTCILPAYARVCLENETNMHIQYYNLPLHIHIDASKNKRGEVDLSGSGNIKLRLNRQALIFNFFLLYVYNWMHTQIHVKIFDYSLYLYRALALPCALLHTNQFMFNYFVIHK